MPGILYILHKFSKEEGNNLYESKKVHLYLSDLRASSSEIPSLEISSSIVFTSFNIN